MNSPSRGVSQWMPMPGVVVTFSSPLRPLAAVGQLGARRLELHEHVVRGAVEQFALLGEDQPARVAVKQRDAELLLERAHLPRHRRLRQPELLAGMGEAAGLGGGVEHLQLVPVHHHVSVLARCAGGGAIPPRAACSAAWCGEEALGFERRHAAQAGGGHRLAIDVVGDVAGGEHARHRGRGRIAARSRRSRSASSRPCRRPVRSRAYGRWR